MNHTEGFEDQVSGKLIDLEGIAVTIAALEDTGRRFLDVIEEIFEMLEMRLRQNCRCCFKGNQSYSPHVFLAPISENPEIGAIPYTNDFYTFVADQKAITITSDGEATEWYHVTEVQFQGSPQDNVISGWVRQADLGEVIDVSSCLDVSEKYAIPDINWDRYAGENQITFTVWPINPQLLCGDHRDEIHGLGIAEPSGINYPQGLHHGIDLFVPSDRQDIVVQSVDHGIVVGIGIQGTNNQFTSHQPIGATESSEGVGYSVIVRYGHLYVTYGHLSYIEDIWVGKEVQLGEALGILGRNNERHLHFEVRSFGVDDLSEYSQNGNNPLSGIIPSGTSPSDTSPPYIYDPIQFLPNPINILQPISGIQQPREAFYTTHNRLFFENTLTDNIIEHGTHLRGNIYSIDVHVSDDCIVRYMVNLDPERIETVDNYRGFVGYSSSTKTFVPPSEITNSSQ